MKGKYALQILTAIGETAVHASDVLRVMIEHPSREAFLTQSFKNLAAIERKRERGKAIREEYFRRANRYKNVVAWLKRDGIVKEVTLKKQRFICITLKGRKYREMLLKRQENALPEPHYAKRKQKRTVIVAFDVPEKEKGKRAWLRQALKSVGFRMIQKSVWFGRAEIPPEMLSDLQRLHLIEFVEIFSVTQKGSLCNLKNFKR
jgi:CRISPR/Cas system-associated endoribonuclease Cas2